MPLTISCYRQTSNLSVTLYLLICLIKWSKNVVHQLYLSGDQMLREVELENVKRQRSCTTFTVIEITRT